MTGPSGPELAEVAEHLRRLLAAIETGELPAEADQVAWLRGAVAALEQLGRA